MNEDDGHKKAKQGFLARIIGRLDKRMQEKTKAAPGCSGQGNKGKKSCCS